MFVYDTAMFCYHSATVIVAKLSEQIDRFDHAIEIARWQHPALVCGVRFAVSGSTGFKTLNF